MSLFQAQIHLHAPFFNSEESLKILRKLSYLLSYFRSMSHFGETVCTGRWTMTQSLLKFILLTCKPCMGHFCTHRSKAARSVLDCGLGRQLYRLLLSPEVGTPFRADWRPAVSWEQDGPAPRGSPGNKSGSRGCAGDTGSNMPCSMVSNRSRAAALRAAKTTVEPHSFSTSLYADRFDLMLLPSPVSPILIAAHRRSLRQVQCCRD